MSDAKLKLGDGVTLGLRDLAYYGTLVQGASGSGKSYFLRLIAEQAAPHVPTIIIDPEGEFVSLREKYDFVLVGPDGEVPASPKNAALLARRLLEMRTSAVIDLYALDQVARRVFVRDFLESLRGAPKSLWGPMLLMLDEGHQFAPESGHGDAASRGAVELFAAERRKRGWGFVLATQRLSKVSKDAVADLATILIGRTSPIDMRRAADMLGIGANEQRRFSGLKNGRWLCTSPAFETTEAREFQADLPQTRPPKTGAKYAPPAPSKRISSVAGELAELAAKPDDEPLTLEQATEQIRKLRGELRNAQLGSTAPPVVDAAALRAGVDAATAELGAWYGAQGAAAREAFCDAQKHMRQASERMGVALAALEKKTPRAALPHSKAHLKIGAQAAAAMSGNGHRPVIGVRAIGHGSNGVAANNAANLPAAGSAGDDVLDEAQGKILRSLAWWEMLGAESPSRAQVAFVAGYTVNGYYERKVGELKQAGYLIYPSGGTLMLTDAGRVAAPSPDTSASVVESVRAVLRDEAQKRSFNALLKAGGPQTRDELAAAAGYTVNGYFERKVGELKTLQLVHYPAKGMVAVEAWVLENEVRR